VQLQSNTYGFLFNARAKANDYTVSRAPCALSAKGGCPALCKALPQRGKTTYVIV